MQEDIILSTILYLGSISSFIIVTFISPSKIHSDFSLKNVQCLNFQISKLFIEEHHNFYTFSMNIQNSLNSLGPSHTSHIFYYLLQLTISFFTKLSFFNQILNRFELQTSSEEWKFLKLKWFLHHTKKYKFKQKLMTHVQKIGTSQHSTLFNRKIKNTSSKVSIYLEAGSQLKSVSIESQGMTISTIILDAIEHFNRKFKYQLPEDIDQYQLYAARKSGKRESDLPALQGQQLISQTKIKKFHLVYFGKILNNIETKQSISIIKSDINVVSGKKVEIFDIDDDSKSSGFFSCLCIQKGK